MGWKNLKEHYGIGHIVQVVEKTKEFGRGADGVCICIGSGYVHDLIAIQLSDLAIIRSDSLGRGKPFDDWVAAMEADKAKLRELIDAPDTFECSITVYTADYYTGEIIEKQCETVGWPNCTHDGRIMHLNDFSVDKAKIVAWAKRNAAAGNENWERNIAEKEKELETQRAHLAQYRASLAKLNCEYPEVDPEYRGKPEPGEEEDD